MNTLILEIKDCQKNIAEGNLVMMNLALYRQSTYRVEI